MISKKHRRILSARMRKRWQEQRESMVSVARRAGKASWAGPKNRARKLAMSRKSILKAASASKIARKGKPLSAEHKANLSIAHKGKKKSPEHCESFRRAWAEGRRVYTMSKEGKERYKAWRATQKLPFRDTKPELKVQSWLDSKGVFYIPHVVCRWMQTRHQWDLYLPRDKLLIEVNGCYWHSCSTCFPDKSIGKFDSVISQYKMVARRNGWDILVLWEHDIKSGFAFNLLGSFIDGYKVAA